MNKFSVFGIYMLLSATSVAQTVSVSVREESIGGEPVKGYATELEGDKDEVATGWIKFLKSTGHVRQSEHIVISDPTLNGTLFSKGILHATIHDKGGKSIVWLGLLPTDWDSKDAGRVNTEIEKTVHQFGVQFYKGKIQKQVDEAQQASEAVERQSQRLVNQARDLAISLSNNEKEKAALEKSLEVNKLENAALLLKINNTKKAQDSLAQSSVQIRKVKSAHLERQQKVQ